MPQVSPTASWLVVMQWQYAGFRMAFKWPNIASWSLCSTFNRHILKALSKCSLCIWHSKIAFSKYNPWVETYMLNTLLILSCTYTCTYTHIVVTTERYKQQNYFKLAKEKKNMQDIIEIFLHQVKAWCTVNMTMTMTITGNSQHS